MLTSTLQHLRNSFIADVRAVQYKGQQLRFFRVFQFYYSRAYHLKLVCACRHV